MCKTYCYHQEKTLHYNTTLSTIFFDAVEALLCLLPSLYLTFGKYSCEHCVNNKLLYCLYHCIFFTQVLCSEVKVFLIKRDAQEPVRPVEGRPSLPGSAKVILLP